MRKLLFLFLVGILSSLCTGQTLPDYTKEARVLCTRTNNILTFTLTVERNSDPLCTMTASNANLDLTPNSQCASNTGNYNATSGLYVFTADVNLDRPNIVTSTSCGVTRVSPSGVGANDEVYRLFVLCRERPQNLDVYGYHDALYNTTCSSNGATNTIVATVDVTLLNPGFNQILTPRPFIVTLHVMRYNPGPNTFTELTSGDTLLVGSEYALEARLVRDANSPRGIYLFNTQVSNNNDFITAAQTQDVFYVILGDDGCPVGTADYVPISQFTEISCQGNLCLSRTGLMTAVQLSGTSKDRLYFRSNFLLCLVDNDARCADFCQVNKPAAGRRKRSFKNQGEYSCEASVLVAESSQENYDTVVIAAVTSVAGLVLVLAIAILCVLLRKRRAIQDKSSESSGSVVYVESFGNEKQVLS